MIGARRIHANGLERSMALRASDHRARNEGSYVSGREQRVGPQRTTGLDPRNVRSTTVIRASFPPSRDSHILNLATSYIGLL